LAFLSLLSRHSVEAEVDFIYYASACFFSHPITRDTTTPPSLRYYSAYAHVIVVTVVVVTLGYIYYYYYIVMCCFFSKIFFRLHSFRQRHGCSRGMNIRRRLAAILLYLPFRQPHTPFGRNFRMQMLSPPLNMIIIYYIIYAYRIRSRYYNNIIRCDTRTSSTTI